MPPRTPERQGSRNEVVSVAVTVDEKSAIQAVASARRITNSDVLRSWTVEEVMKQAERIRAAVAEPPARQPVGDQP